MNTISEFISHLSEQPWSSWTSADYTLEQWHAACLIHQHDGPPTSKGQCKLPVKTPNGTVNRNGVHAAAAALAGARGGVHASADEKNRAKAAIRRLYAQMDEKPPPSMAQSNVWDFIKHHGVKGMHWGVRKDRSGKSRSTERTRFSKSPKKLTNEELKRRIARMETEKRYNELNKRDISAGEKLASEILTNTGRTVVTTIAVGGALLAIKTALNAKFGSGSPRSAARTQLGLKALPDIGTIVTKRGK